MLEALCARWPKLQFAVEPSANPMALKTRRWVDRWREAVIGVIRKLKTIAWSGYWRRATSGPGKSSSPSP